MNCFRVLFDVKNDTARVLFKEIFLDDLAIYIILSKKNSYLDEAVAQWMYWVVCRPQIHKWYYYNQHKTLSIKKLMQ